MITISITDISIRFMVLTSEAPSASCPQAWLKNQSANNSNKQEGRERRHSQGVNNTGGSQGRAGSTEHRSRSTVQEQACFDLGELGDLGGASSRVWILLTELSLRYTIPTGLKKVLFPRKRM